MEHVGGHEQWQLDELSSKAGDNTPSAESFIEDLEDQLACGEITIEQAIAAMQDWHRRE